jgi:hypothetical protein
MMKKAIARISRAWLDFLLFELVGAGLGMLIGIFVSGQSQAANGLTDPTPYQNFALFTGVTTGFTIGFMALVCYLLVTRFARKREAFSSRRLLWTGGIAGAIISLATYCIVTASAESYGMIERTGAVTVFDAVMSAILGGGTGGVVSALLSAVRGYEG